MARQARSTATRAKIIAAAIDVFGEKGFASTSLGDIVERAAMTKGALYYHFDSKEALATAIIDEGSAIVLNQFRNVCTAPSPAVENMIHGTFVIAATVDEDPTAHMGAVLARALSDSLEAPGRAYRGLLDALTEQAERAAAEGDLNQAVQPRPVGELIVFALLGAEVVIASHPDSTSVAARLAEIWQTLLPGVVAPAALPFLREYLARETAPGR